MKLFAQIRKVDEEKRLVYGRAVQEVADRVGEVFDYATSKPYFEEWSKSFHDATDGKSKGNIRAMHGKVSAGIVKEIDFADAEKAIDIAAHINDDAEWKKVLDGNYTGFSIGGSYVGQMITEKMDGKDVKRYTANPSEISIVDSPCIPSAKFFQVVKADGAVLEKAFAPAPTEVVGTDEEVQEFGRALNASGFTMGDAIGFIAKAVAERDAPKDELAETIAEALKIGGMRDTLNKASLGVLADECDKALGAGEFDKMLGELSATDTVATAREKIVAKVMEKVTLSDAHKGRLQQAHDHLQAIGAMCGGNAKAATADDLQKVVGDVTAKLAEAMEKIAKLESQPVPHVMLRAVAKGYEKPSDPAAITTPAEKGAAEEQQAELLAKGYAWLVKGAEGVIDWKASAEKLANEQRAAA